MKNISIANDFSIYPGGRTPDDGEYSGEEFRNTFLIPMLDAGEQAEINFDGTRGYGSSFLEEAFGGLVRSGHNSKKIYSIFKFISSRESIIDEVKEYINNADILNN